MFSLILLGFIVYGSLAIDFVPVQAIIMSGAPAPEAPLVSSPEEPRK